MKECQEHWCENYGKNNNQCVGCDKRAVVKDNPNLRDIIKRRAVKVMEIDKNKGQGR